MIRKIAHLADIHIYKVTTRHEEYKKVFENLYKSLEENNPDRIVIVGDLFQDYTELGTEQITIASAFLRNLSKIAPVIITRGNHDINLKNRNRKDAIKAIIETMDHKGVKYYDKTGFYDDENILWAVWNHGEEKNNPYKLKDWKKWQKIIITDNEEDKPTIIDLFHDPINGAKTTSNFTMKKSGYYKTKDFKGDYSFFGDIHKKQYFEHETKAYCGSLIAQDFSEGDDLFHGYLLWNISKDDKIEEISISNETTYKNIIISQFTDFDDLDIEIENPTNRMNIRFIWQTLPYVRNIDNERKLKRYFKTKYSRSELKFYNKNEFLEEDRQDDVEELEIEKIYETETQQGFFKEYLEKIGVEDQLIKDVLILDDKISLQLETPEIFNVEWDVVKFSSKNLLSYETLDIDWRDKNGLIQIMGDNTAGKTTILNGISYVLYGKTLETKIRKKYGDARFLNNKLNVDSCEGNVVIEANNVFYGIKRITQTKKDKHGALKGASTQVFYYLLKSPDEEMNDDTSINILTDNEKNATQNKINEIIGTYENFIRLILTTSDTLNKILSDDMSVFIDSILYDSGLDLFDRKLNLLKDYIKEEEKKQRVFCDVEKETEKIKQIKDKIKETETQINNKKNNEFNEVSERIKNGRKYIEVLTRQLFNIDEELKNLNREETKNKIETHKNETLQLENKEKILNKKISELIETYDEKKLEELEKEKEEIHQKESEFKLKIKDVEREIDEEKHQIEINNGKVFQVKKEGKEKKDKINELKESKTCPTCGQPLTEKHLKHIQINIKEIINEAQSLAKEIEVLKENNIIHEDKINELKEKIKEFEKEKEELSGEKLTNILTEINKIKEDKKIVEERQGYTNELKLIPLQKENIELNIKNLEQKILDYDNNLKQIKSNLKIEEKIKNGKLLLEELEKKKTIILEEINKLEKSILLFNENIKDSENLIKEFKEQEYKDSVYNYYKKCVHRDGVPRQILRNHILPKINKETSNILAVSPFNVYLDAEDLRPKLVYYDAPEAVIDAISASGKERTFASIALKVALTQINVKSKPSLFLLDEIMGKLTGDHVNEFIEILQNIKNKYNHLLIIEHNHEVQPDYIIYVTKDENKISHADLKNATT